jgi:VRR-NUC domain
MARFVRSYRETLRSNNAADKFYAAMHGKEPAFQNDVKPKRERVAVPDPNAPPMERDVLRAVWKFLAHHPRVAWIARMNSGAFKLDDERFVRLNSKRGMSDLIGQMKDGRFLACEVKREGAALMDHQRDFLNEVRQNGGVAFVARNLDDAEQALLST